MPGIVGIIRRVPYQGIDTDLRLMTETMKHECFYTAGSTRTPMSGCTQAGLVTKKALPTACH